MHLILIYAIKELKEQIFFLPNICLENIKKIPKELCKNIFKIFYTGRIVTEERESLWANRQ